MIEVLKRFELSSFTGVKELADTAAIAVSALGINAGKGPNPNERLVRYYLNEKLIPEATDKSGTSSVFTYHHLLSIIAIKRLQGLGFPLTLIKQAIEDRSIEELERLIIEDVKTKVVDDPTEAARYNAMSQVELEEHFGEPVQKITDPAAIRDQIHAESIRAETKKNPAKEFLEGLLFSRTEKRKSRPSEDVLSMASSISVSGTGRSAPASNQERWTRHEIEPGLELHVSDDFRVPSGYRNVKKLLERIRAVLRAL